MGNLDTVGVKYEADVAELIKAYQLIIKETSILFKSVDALLKKYNNLGTEASADLKDIDKQTADLKQTNVETVGIINTLIKKEQDLLEARNASNDIKQISKYNKELEKTKRELEGLTGAASRQGSAISNNTKEAKGFQGVISKVGPALAATFAVDKILEVGSKIITITAEFEKFEAVLTNTLGSKGAALGALDMIVDFAVKTPFAVNELTDSFVKLANTGFIPTEQEMTKLGDLASSQGKSFDMLTEAIIDAQTGEFERLKEFGIRASKEGDNVKFSFKGVETQTKFTADAIQDYIVGLGSLEGVAGGMAAISETLGGKISNLGDALDGLFKRAGDEGSPTLMQFIDILIEVLNNFELLTPAAEEFFGAIGDLFTSIGGLIELFYDFGEQGMETKDVMSGLGVALKVMSVPLTLVVQLLKLGVDGFALLVNEGKKLMNFFGSDFEIDTTLTREKLVEDVKAMTDTLSLKGKGQEMKNMVKKETFLLIDPLEALNKEREKKAAEAAARRKAKEAEVTKEEKAAIDKANKEKLQAENAYLELLIANMKEGIGKEYAIEQLRYKKQQESLKGNNLALEQAEIAHQKRMAEIRKENQIQQIGNTVVTADTIKGIDKKYKTQQEKELAETAAKANEAQEKNLALYNAKKDKEKEKEAQVAQAREEITNSVFEATFAIEEARREARFAKMEADLQKQREFELSNKNLTETQKSEIDAKFDKMEAELQTKQAKREKAVAITQATIAGALAVTKLLATPPLAIAAGIAAALQIATIAATPIPEFKEGVIDLQGPGTMTSDSIHAKLSRGESVMTGQETKRYKDELIAMRKGQFEEYVTSTRVIPVVKKALEQKETASNLANSLALQASFDDTGIIRAVKGVKHATSNDIKELGRSFNQSLKEAAYINSKMWKA